MLYTETYDATWQDAVMYEGPWEAVSAGTSWELIEWRPKEGKFGSPAGRVQLLNVFGLGVMLPGLFGTGVVTSPSMMVGSAEESHFGLGFDRHLLTLVP